MIKKVTRQEIHWVPEGRRFELSEKPYRVWTVIGNYDPDNKPELPIVPSHRHNAFLEDWVHDWNWKNGVFRYYSRVADHSVWVLIEYT